jgi:DNA-binding Lrp family transcriptional regulator
VANAFILISTELGSETDVMKELKKIDETKEAHKVYGVYDIIARIEADNMENLKDVISLKVRRISMIRSTLTMMIM